MPSSLGAPTQVAPRTERWLPHAVIATAFVVVVPALAVWAIVPRGDAALLALSVPLGMLLSVLAASAGGAIWKRAPGSRDLVFADLMLWGWLRRLRAERRLARAETLLGLGAEGLSVQALTSLSALLEARDGYTYGHSQRVTRHAERIARAMGLSATDVAKVRTAAALHDVGKLHTPRDILNKPGRLTDEEFEVIRHHPGDGAAMATGLDDPMITAMIRHHHERLDGGGYPAGLAGNAIPLGARIIAVADTFDAMTSNRAYRGAASHKHALAVLRAEAGTQLDGAAVAAFVGYYRGRRTVAWSAFAMAAPQRLFAWLGGVSPGISAGAAGAAGAAALAIGVATPQPPAITPVAAASQRVAQRTMTAERAPAHTRPAQHPLGDAPAASGRRPARGDAGQSPGTRSRPQGARRRSGAQSHRPAAQGNSQAAAPPTVKVENDKPQAVKPDKVVKPPAVKPDKVKPQTGKPDKVKPQTVKPEKVEPQVVKPPKVTVPAVKPPKVTVPAVKPPKATPLEALPAPAAPPTAKPPKP
jgi:putative nucleotidyltransferase with HDIG domain